MNKTNLISAAKALLFFIVCGLIFAFYHYLTTPSNTRPNASIALLIADDAKLDDPQITIWLDAAREEGLLLDVLRSSEFLRPTSPWKKTTYQGLILPDKAGQKAAAALTQRLFDYTQQGGQLFVAFDAATHTQQDAFYPNQAPLSKLVGVDYALYDQLLERSIQFEKVWGEASTLEELGVPPGKHIPYTAANTNLHPQQPSVIAGYEYGPLNYPSFVTRGDYSGQRLLSSAKGDLVAGYRTEGQGGVLFVNLPLGYLKGQTDGLLLHGFLHYFAQNILGLPTLSAAPEGRGGIIFNWHVDSNAAVIPIEKMQQLGFLKQGPFSIHFTAGPDTREKGDGLGLNLSHNKTMQNWVQVFKQRGDALGNHGGWIHDYFGLNVTEENHAEFLPFIEQNNQSVSSSNGAQVREYSAPLGVQPQWVTDWLEQQGFAAYYFTGNSGMAPTRSYREGKLSNHKIWSFPVLTFGEIASFEEAAKHKMPESEVATWLKDFSDFSANKGTVRMFYSHPPGVMLYPQAVRNWFNHTQTLLDKKTFAWYTMTDMADFLTRRELTEWNITQGVDQDILNAQHPTDMHQLTWQFPKKHYQRPQIESGAAQIQDNDKNWLVIAGKTRQLTLKLKRKI